MRCLVVVVFGRLVCLVVAAPPAPKVKLWTLATIRQSLVLFENTLVAHWLVQLSLDSVACREQWLRTNLVDPASSHMLVSKIKPCMSQYKLLYGETANGSLKQL